MSARASPRRSWWRGTSRVGDAVTPDTIIAEVLTDKATVEIYAPVAGTVAFLTGEPGDVLAVGGDFVGIETGGAAPPAVVAVAAPGLVPAEVEPAPVVGRHDVPVTAAPSVRQRARRLGIDLADVVPCGAHGRISHEDLDDHLITGRPSAARPARPAPTALPSPTPTQMPTPGAAPVPADAPFPIIGLRRRIASRMTEALSVPHITYVDEVDVTQLERLRRSLTDLYPGQPRLTVLAFLVRSIVLAVADHPQINATFDDRSEPQVLTKHAAVHIGIATQTPSGLIVPVLHDGPIARSVELGGRTVAGDHGGPGGDGEP